MNRWTATAWAVAFAASPATAEPFKISYAGTNTNFAQYYAAADKGYFKDEGLDVELVLIPGGIATPALVSGDLLYSGSPSSAMSAILRGAALKIILIGQSHPIYTLWSLDPAVTRLEDLKGRIVAVTVRGGTDELAMRMILANRNLSDNFLALSPTGTDSNMVAALISGAQMNGILSRSEQTMLKNLGGLAKANLILDFQNQVTLETGGLVTSDKELTEHPDRVLKVLRAVWKGTLYLMTQKEGLVDLMSKREPSLAHDLVVADVEAGMAGLERTGMMPDAAAAKELSARAAIIGLPPSQVPPVEKVYDFRPLREAIGEVAASGWKPAP